MDLEAGTQVTPVVRLVRPLGRGGMGAVWVAEHQTLRTEVVVKFMSDALAADPVSLARFSHEASAAAAVKSPHVVQMLDHGFTADGTPFIVMELLDGEDLRKRLQRDQVIPLPELALILTQACKALGRAHSSGIVHRDIKPDNIFLCRTDDGEPFVKILDFGIAKSGGPAEFHVTQTGVMVGTPFYMSPEQAMGNPPVDATTDLWSLGVVAFEAMTGRRPFDGVTIGALTVAICSERPPVPSALNPEIPPAIDAWLARACARDRRERFVTAKVMSEALAQAVKAVGPSRAVPLAFDETSLRRRSDPPPLAPRPPVLASTPPPPPESASMLTTTTAAVSRNTEPPIAAATPYAPAPAAVVKPVPVRRVSYLQAAIALVVLAGVGIGGGFVFAVRDASPPAVSAPVPARVAAPPSAVASASAPPVAPAASAPSAPPPSATAASPTPSAATAPPKAIPTHVPAPVIHPPAVASSGAKEHATATPPVTAHGCDPPFYFDSSNNKVFKKECL